MIKRYRAQRIEIDLPKEESAQWVHVTVQTTYKRESDYATVQTVDRTHHVHRKVDDVATEIKSITDPVTGKAISASGAGCAALIRHFIGDWMAEDLNGERNEHGDIVAKG